MADARFRWGAWVGALGLALVAGPAAAQTQPAGQVTFTKDVAPIFQKACESCHRKDSIGPMSLVTYEEARPWARSIKARVAARQMPPWHIDKNVGIQHFQNDRSLTDAQIATIVKWVDTGAPKGDMKDMPAPVKWPNEETWNFTSLFGEPDLIIKSPAYKMPAQAQDAWYKPVVPTGLTEPRYVRAIEMRPGTVQGRKITHHALARLQQKEGEAPGSSAPRADDDPGPGLFMEWAVGKQGEIMRENSGKLMLPGSSIVWDIHYHAVGEEITDTVEMAVYFYPKGQEPKYRQTLSLYSGIAGGNRNLDIPPNTVAVTQNFHVMRKAGRVENFQPHMHLRGKAMSMEAILPTGQTQMLSMVSEYNFNWHTNYVYADDAAPLLPKGTILRITSWHDNTKDNPNNPDPNQWVGWGDRTVDEMAHAWVNITYMDDEDYKAEVEKRKAKTSTTTADQQQ
ncbi:MAG: cytochrome c [Acidobacteria bacterium]|nr:cytochrome c [Acidobacteriota bacterium]